MNCKDEIWKDIIGHEGSYQISNLGRVKSLRRKKVVKGNKPYYIPCFVMKNILNGSNYYQICLYKNGVSKIISIHRLVSIHFIDNPNNFKVVNHIDSNTKNNSIDNLEWCTQKHNFNHAIKLGNVDFYKYRKEIKRVCVETGASKIYKGVNDVKIDGFSPSAVSRCANGIIKKYRGCVWEFMNLGIQIE